MNIIICDDDPDFAQSFRRLLADRFAAGDWTCHITVFTEAERLLSADLSDVHVLFLDIAMAGLDGLEAGGQLRRRYPELLIVIVTAYLEYAPAGYRIRAFRYLMKDRIPEGELDRCLEDIREELYDSDRCIEVRDATRTVQLFRLRDILYLEGSPRRHTLFHLAGPAGAPPVECLGKLSDFESRLEGRGFLRIQKSYLANMRRIDHILGYKARMDNGEELRISARNYAAIRERYLQWRGQQL